MSIFDKGSPEEQEATLIMREAHEKLAELTKERDALRDALSTLSSWLGQGLGDDTTSAEDYEKRIREGVDTLLRMQLTRTRSLLREIHPFIVSMSHWLPTMAEEAGWSHTAPDKHEEVMADVKRFDEAITEALSTRSS